jgi:hypothetical protein
MRTFFFLLTIIVAGCAKLELPSVAPAERVLHAKGFSVGRISDWVIENNPTYPTIEQHLNLRGRGSSEVVLSVTLLGHSDPGAIDQPERPSNYSDEILEENTGKKNRTEVMLKKRVDKTWFRVHVSTSIDRPQALAFARLVADSIRLEKASTRDTP